MNNINDAKKLFHWHSFIKQKKEINYIDLPSWKIVKLSSKMKQDSFIGYQIFVPKNGLAEFIVFAGDGIKNSEMEWIAENVAKIEEINLDKVRKLESKEFADNNLYELVFPVSEEIMTRGNNVNLRNAWPLRTHSVFSELMNILSQEGGVLRAYFSKVDDDKMKKSRARMISNWNMDNINAREYIGEPIYAKFLLLLPNEASARLKVVLSNYIKESKLLFLGKMNNFKNIKIFNEASYESKILPEFAAMKLVLNPLVFNETILGIKSVEPDARERLIDFNNAEDVDGIKVGIAKDTTGAEIEIKLNDFDLKRHWQIIGQTGTGKSSMLANVLSEAIKKGKGVTFFDPHGTTIDILLNMISDEDAPRVRVFRMGDEENPIPVNVWNSDTVDEAERTISDLSLLLSEIFDPDNKGYVGPRWERWFNTFATASVAFLGKSASFDSIVTLSQSRDNMRMLANAIQYRKPELSRRIKEEYINMNNDFGDLINWAVSKMQRLTSVKALRNNLGAGVNVADFENTIDINTVTLIDLAMPKLGTHAARIMANILLLQLWNAIVNRKDRTKNHIIAIDEAHLFQNNPLPQILAEGRKFGVSAILVHQHNGQFVDRVKDALDANAANLSAFRLSVRDAKEIVSKFDDLELYYDLCRLNAFNSLNTFSMGGEQTRAFTMKISKPEEGEYGEEVAESIEENSIENYVEPYRKYKALDNKALALRLKKYSKNPLPPYNIKKVGSKEIFTTEVPDYIMAMREKYSVNYGDEVFDDGLLSEV